MTFGTSLRSPRAAALIAAAVLALSACGSDDDADTTAADPAGATSTATEGSSGASSAEETLRKATADIPYEGPETASAPESGKTIAVIPCAAAASGCMRVVDGAKAAAETLGWKVKTIDGQGQASTQNAAIQQAVSQNVDGIILGAVDSKSVSQGMSAAESKGIPVVSIQADNPVGSGAGEVFAEPDSGSKRGGDALGAFVATDSGNKAKIAVLSSTELAVTRNRKDSFVDAVEQYCDGCEVVKQDNYLLSSALKDVPLKVQAMLQANPTIDYFFVDVGQYGALTAQAIQSAGRDVKVVSVDCNPDDLEALRGTSPIVACAGNAIETSGWAGMAALNERFAGKDSAADFISPMKVLTAENVPDTKVWEGDFDAKEAYSKLWGMNQ